ncbi:MAG TPA: erythromycin esterase family protein [Terriglobales bacterium]|jgi:erythromycin esterase-like protein|nr:erythromycin esterase family protein [Terriglobales bacterium]
MRTHSDFHIVNAIRRAAHRLTGESADFDPLLNLIGDSRLVLIGEASHGTHEFYRLRAEITKSLIAERGFNAVAVEADWPDAYRINQFVRFQGKDHDAIDALAGFQRFPAWMWRNADVLDFVGWLRNYNEHRHSGRAGFYGLDLYSLHASIRAVLDFLDKVDPEAARRARYRYACFEDFGEDTQAYGYAASFGLSKSCEDEVISQWMEMRQRAADLARRDGHAFPDEFFFAEQNARLVKNAEEYYRSMFRERTSSWNLRDTHMAETLDALVQHLGASHAKVVVWAHNSHLGDARATEMGQHGELNLGQLVRQRYGKQSISVGFTTYTGTVTAATEWDGAAERKHVRPALPGSYEALFHTTGMSKFLLLPNEHDETRLLLREPRLERAIGVIYQPRSERQSHYFHAQLPDQFDAILHFDETRAVEPLERTTAWEAGEVPETYPSAL